MQMKDTLKISVVKKKNEREECIEFLKECHSVNLYLYEGIKDPFPKFLALSIKYKKRLIGVLHTKNRVHLHICFSHEIMDSLIKQSSSFLLKGFPHLKSIFGDKSSILNLTEKGSIYPSSCREFIFMETDKKLFNPKGDFKGIMPHTDRAELLLPLQIQYEVEEMAVDYQDIQRDKVLKVLKRRLERGEVTAIFDGNSPVAFACINARFENVCQVGSVYVLPLYRGKGYGYSIVSSHVERFLKKYDRVALFVDRKNKGAIHLYGNLGFYPAGELLQVQIH